MCVRQVGGAGDEGIDLRGWWYTPAAAARVVPVAGPSRTGGTRGRMSDWMREVEDAKRNAAAMPGWGMGGSDQFTKEGWTGQEGVDGVVGQVEDTARRLRVLAQCKAEGKACSGRVVRELEGVMAHFHGESGWLQDWHQHYTPRLTAVARRLSLISGMDWTSGTLLIPGREMELGPHQYDKTGRRLDRAPPSTVAVLLSRSGFSENATIRAWRSPSPMILVHLPGGSSINPNERDDGTGEEGKGMRVTGCWMNPALSGLKGLLGGTIEVRREILKEVKAGEAGGDEKLEKQEKPGVRDQWRFWYKGKRMGRVGPSIDEALGGKVGGE